MQNSLKQIKNIPFWTQAVGAGLLLGVSVVSPYAGWLVFLGIYICLRVLLSVPSLGQVVFFGWLTFLMKGMVVLSFLFSIYPVTSFPIASIWYEVGLVVWSWFMSALSLSFGGVVLGGLVYLIPSLIKSLPITQNFWHKLFYFSATIFRYGSEKYNGFYSKILSSSRNALIGDGIVKEKLKSKIIIVVTVPIIWLVGELAGSLGYSIVTLGANSFIQTHFSMGYVGYALAGLPGYIGLSILYGVYGLSFLATLLVILWLVAENIFHKKIVIGAILLLGIIGFGISNNVSTSVSVSTQRVLTIDTVFESDSTRDEEKVKKRAKILAEAVASANEYQPQYIILPEDSRYLDSLSGYQNIRQAYALYQFVNSEFTANIIDTGRVAGEQETDPAILRSYIFSATRTPVISDKKYLTPQGEYLPYLTALLVKATGNRQALDHPSLINYRVGDLITPKRYEGPLVLFCFESIKPTAVRELVQVHEVEPAFIAHPISHAWFHLPLLLTHQLDTMLRIQAVWNGTTIISAGNHAVGKTYLPSGMVNTNVELARGEGWVIRESVH